MDEPILSIVVLTYGHEQYIREALDSILMQETKYKYEVLVGEDASPDATREILQEYEKKYPSVFTMFYRSENMGAYENGLDLLLRCRGKYIVPLEGDDFWLDADKIEKQVSFLESHEEYLAVAHNCCVVDKESKPSEEKYPECKENEYTLAHYANGILPGQSTTIMYRNCYRDQLFDISLLKTKLMPGDRLLYFTLICNGRIYCIQECKSAYRYVPDSGTSFSATFRYKYAEMAKWHLAQIEYACQIGHREALEISQLLYVYNMCVGLKFGQLPAREIKTELRKANIKYQKAFLYTKRSVFHRFFGKQLWDMN